MKQAIRILGCGLVAMAIIMVSGCATSQPPPALSYVSVARPSGPIKGGGQRVEMKHSRGGPYFLNAGFRPAPDVGAYIDKAQTAAGSDVLNNADVEFNVPFVIDILLFGFQVGSDTVKANQ